MPSKLLVLLLWDNDWIVEESDLLVVAACGDEGPARTHVYCVYIGVVDVLMDLLYAGSEFACPCRPLRFSTG